MGRATTPTWLPLDRWAEIFGINPLHFNGVHTSLSPDSACNGEDIWKQYAWQDASKVSREDLAEAINEAERIISDYVGYYLLPDWRKDERHTTERPAMRDLYSSGVNVRGLAKSVHSRYGYVISGGQKASSLIQATAAIVRDDPDGDGYTERCTVTVTTTVDAEEIRVYFPGESGADEWEIRPATVTKSGNTATIRFKIWQVPDPDLWERISATGIDGDLAGNFITTVDVYRVYNDPQSQLQLLWEPDQSGVCGCGSAECAVCTFAAQNGCLHVRDTRLGLLAYSPASWDATNSEFDSAEFSVSRDPDRLRLWYYSGWRDESRARPTVELDRYWERAIAYFSAALMEREICACNNVEHFIDHYRTDLARIGREVSWQNTPRLLDNPFGTRRGAVYAWQRANQEDRFIQR